MDFELPEDDVGFLNNSFEGRWSTIINSTEQGIIIRNYSLPEGYDPSEVKVMILIPQNYPMAALDMFYLCPGTFKKNGHNIEQLSDESHFDKQWQRWSRHYEWQAGTNNIAIHLKFVENALIDELKK